MQLSVDERAKQLATEVHAGQVYSHERPYIYHPEQVGELARRLGYDERVVAAGYLHDVLEKTSYSETSLRQEFGDFITDAVVAASYFERDEAAGIGKAAKAKKHIAGHVVKYCDANCNLANLIMYGPKAGRELKPSYDEYQSYLDELRLGLPTPAQVAAAD